MVKDACERRLACGVRIVFVCKPYDGSLVRRTRSDETCKACATPTTRTRINPLLQQLSDRCAAPCKSIRHRPFSLFGQAPSLCT